MSDNLEIVGFDLGHGESALAHTTLVSANEPEALSIHNRPTVLSVVGVDADGRVAIGENALRQAERMAEMFVRFKVAAAARRRLAGRARAAAVRRRHRARAGREPAVAAPRGGARVRRRALGLDRRARSARRLETYRAALQAAGLRACRIRAGIPRRLHARARIRRAAAWPRPAFRPGAGGRSRLLHRRLHAGARPATRCRSISATTRSAPR